MKILTFTTLYPNAAMPLNAVFVRRRMEACAQHHGHELTVIAPVPYFPRLPFSVNEAWDRFARVPVHESPWGYDIYHPRYLVTPKFGMRFYGRWMAASAMALARRLHAERCFDAVDGHYVYPDGEAAVALAAELNLPLVLSSRGTDLNLYPTIGAIRPRIIESLRKADHLICVCEELRQVALGLGLPRERASVIGNGIDPAMFTPRDRDSARFELGLDQHGTILLSVGHLTERKGFHLLIQALAQLVQDPSPPTGPLKLIIVGDGPQRGELLEIVQRLNLQDRVLMPGAVAQDQLPPWYAASDLFLLASSREGWPNVLCEAQAMGLPIIASRAWGIPEIVSNSNAGILVDERSPSSFAGALRLALQRDWDRTAIAELGGRRTWPVVATEVDAVLQKVVREFKRQANAKELR